MNVPGITCLMLTALLCVPYHSALAAREEAPEVTADGMHRVPDTKLGLVYADPDADLSGYHRILLVAAQVAFRKNWQRDININKPYVIRDQDVQNIRNSVSALFGEIFTAELTAGGYELTDEQAEDVLIVRPAILDLNVNSPESAMGRTRSLSQSAGDMTLYLELRDSLTGDILVKALDFQFDRSNITPHIQDRTRNERAARQILTNWAQTLVKGLDEARAITSGRRESK